MPGVTSGLSLLQLLQLARGYLQTALKITCGGSHVAMQCRRRTLATCMRLIPRCRTSTLMLNAYKSCLCQTSSVLTPLCACMLCSVAQFCSPLQTCCQAHLELVLKLRYCSAFVLKLSPHRCDDGGVLCALCFHLDLQRINTRDCSMCVLLCICQLRLQLCNQSRGIGHPWQAQRWAVCGVQQRVACLERC